MRRGRTVVIESGHLVVLGAADQLPGLVQQVGLGASPARPSTVVVLAEGDPAVIDRRVRAAGFDRRAVRVVLRSGDPRLLADLHLVRPTRARGIVVLHDDEPHDARVVRTVLAVTELLGDTSTVPIVVEVREAGTTERLMDACGPMVHPLHTTAALARTAAFALRGPELGQVLDELLQVGGVDIQVRDGADVDGSSFGDLVRRSGSDRPIGLLGTDGVLELHPPDGRVLRAGEQLVSIGHAPGAPVPAARRREDHPARPGRARSATTTPAARAQRSGAPAGDDGRLLVVGWNMFGQWLLSEWADNAHGRAVEVVLAGRDASAAVPELPDATPLTVQRPTSLAAYLEARGGLGDLSTVVLLPAIDERDPEDADTRTLLDLGLLRRLRGDRPHPRFVVQLVDVDHVPLARLNGPDDWLIDPGAGAQLMVQLVDEPRRRAVLLALYADGGSSLAAVPARELGLVDQVRTSAVIQAATEAGLLALGWHRSLPDGPELVLAPATGAHVDLAPDDTIIVVT